MNMPTHSEWKQMMKKRCRRGNAGSHGVLTAKSNYHWDLGEITDYPPLLYTPLLPDYISLCSGRAPLLTVTYYFACKPIVMILLTMYVAFSTKYTIMLHACFEVSEVGCSPPDWTVICETVWGTCQVPWVDTYLIATLSRAGNLPKDARRPLARRSALMRPPEARVSIPPPHWSEPRPVGLRREAE